MKERVNVQLPRKGEKVKFELLRNGNFFFRFFFGTDTFEISFTFDIYLQFD